MEPTWLADGEIRVLEAACTDLVRDDRLTLVGYIKEIIEAHSKPASCMAETPAPLTGFTCKGLLNHQGAHVHYSLNNEWSINWRNNG